MNLPKISIITPSYNQGEYIERTINSVLNQGYLNTEYIIVDGGSTDHSVEIIRKYEGKLSYWVSEPDRGQSHALNKGFALVTGDLVGWIASDDWYHEEAFDIVSGAFLRNPDSIILGDCMLHYGDNGKLRHLRPKRPTFRSMSRYWRYGFCPPQPSIFFPTRLMKQVGLLNENLQYAMDLDFWLRMVKVADFMTVSNVLSHYLIHEKSKSGSGKGLVKFEDEWRAVCEKHIENASVWHRTVFCFDRYLDKVSGRLEK